MINVQALSRAKNLALPLLFGGMALFLLSGCGSEDITEAQEARFYVERVVDGDTFRGFFESGQLDTVRLLGIDAPEISHDPQGSDECYGREARAALRDAVEEQWVTLERNDPVPNRDRYERLLRHVRVEFQDQSFDMSLSLLQTGNAKLNPFSETTRLSEYEEAQSIAQRGLRGIWGKCDEDEIGSVGAL